MTVTRTDIEAAASRIRMHVRRTPVLHVAGGTFGTHPPLVLKLEYLQHSGSFKARGAFNAVLRLDNPDAGVAAASGGNHGAAVAFAAKALGVNATIFVPEIASSAKIEKIRGYGADIRIGGARYQDAAEACARFQAETGAANVHAYDAPATIAGQGTTAREWDAQSPDLETLIIAVGGGGLIGGFAAWHGAKARLIAAETHGTRAFAAALEAGEPTPVDVSGVAADSLGAKTIGALPFSLAKAAHVGSVTVDDEAVLRARCVLWDKCRILTEPGAATALAAVIDGQVGGPDDAPIGVLVCGANTPLQDI